MKTQGNKYNAHAITMKDLETKIRQCTDKDSKDNEMRGNSVEGKNSDANNNNKVNYSTFEDVELIEGEYNDKILTT